MTKKTIIFDTDDESKGHYPSDEAYAPLEIGKVYNVTEDTTDKHIVVSPVDANSSLPTMKLGELALEINTKNTYVGGPLLTGTTIIKEQGVTSLAALMTDGDILGHAWGGSLTQPEKLSGFIKRSIEATVQGDPSSGWTRLNNGLLLQWGAIVAENNSSVGTITFPTAFTKTCSFVAQTYGAVTGPNGVAISCLANDDNSLTSQKIRCIQIQTGQVVDAAAWYVKWIAIGY